MCVLQASALPLSVEALSFPGNRSRVAPQGGTGATHPRPPKASSRRYSLPPAWAAVVEVLGAQCAGERKSSGVFAVAASTEDPAGGGQDGGRGGALGQAAAAHFTGFAGGGGLLWVWVPS
jgi:hypothetical protein